MNNCDVEIHNEMIVVGYIDCLLCNEQLQKPSTKHIPCYDKEFMIDDNGAYICRKLYCKGWSRQCEHRRCYNISAGQHQPSSRLLNG